MTRITNAFLALMLAASLSLAPTSFGSAQDGGAYVSHVSSTDPEETGPLNPVGLAFSASSQSFYIVEEPGQGPNLLANTSEVIAITPLGEADETTRLAELIEDPLNIVFDNKGQRLLAFQPSTGRLVEVREHPGGQLDRTLVVSRNTPGLSVQDPAGMTLDEASGELFILDAALQRITRVQLGTGRVLAIIDLASSAIAAPRGIAFDPSTGHLHVFDLIDQTLYELTPAGKVVNTRALGRFGLKSPHAMVFAPSGDQTDDPAQLSLFVADSGLVAGRGTNSLSSDESNTSTESMGQIMEFSMIEPAATAASSFTSVVIRSLDMSEISPPGPDPSGLAYLPFNNSLMVSDGEVEEIGYNITHFQGANVWELTLGGSVIRTANISPVEPTLVPMSDEPTGVAWNPNDNHYYFSDDTGSVDLYDLNPGADGLVGTSDDTWIGRSLSSFGVGDAEGVAYDSWDNRLWVVDGANAEVYQFTPAGAYVSQFDVLQYGVVDPEAVEFNPNTGTLFVMSSNNASPVIIETTRTGALLQTIDISAANARVPAGLAYGPASDGSGARHFYIVDRGYDNNENGNLIDGKLFEMTAPTPGSTPTPSNTALPVNSATPTSTAVPPGSAFFASFALNGTVSGLSFADEDIVYFDGQSWSLFFDGSDVGAGGSDLFAFHMVNANTLLMAFNTDLTLSGMTVTPQDIVRFDATSLGANTAGTFSMYFNGADVGLAEPTAERIDAINVLSDGRILISTAGDISVPGVTGKDEDIAVFTPASLGNTTSGTWAMYFDGSDVGLSDSSDEDIDALDVAGGHIYLSTIGNFAVTGLTGAGEDVFICSPSLLGDVTACNFSPALFLDGSAWGLAGNSLDAFHLQTANTAPPATATSSPIVTPTSSFTATPSFTPSPSRTPTTTGTPTNTSTPSNTPTHTVTPPPLSDSFFASFAQNGSVGGVAFADEDIVRFDGQNWILFFDGSDVGVGGIDLFGFSIVDADTILMAFSAGVTLNGMAVTPYDIVRFDATSLGPTTAGTFSMYFNGGDVGFDSTAEKIDAVALLADGRLLISTTGNPSVPGVSARDEDVLVFTPTSLGTNTSGTWAMYFDASDVGLSDSSEDVDALQVVNGSIYLSTSGAFAVSGIAGAAEDVFVCTPVSLGDTSACNFNPALFFDGSASGLSGNNLDGFFQGGANSTPSTPTSTHTPASTATGSLTPTATRTPTSLFTPSMTNTPTQTAIPSSTFTATATSTITNTPTPGSSPTDTPMGSAADLIFANGFETGNFSGWTSVSNGGGDLSVTSSAAIAGSYGLQAIINDTTAMYVNDDSPAAEPRYRFRFDFDPNSLSMRDGDAHIIFRGYSGTTTVAIRVEFGFSSGAYQIRAALVNDGSTWTDTNWFPLSDGPHSVELDWRAATSAGANNGGLTLWLDGVPQADITGVDNDTLRLDRARLGALASIDTGTSGTYYFDAFESRRQTYIGP